ncbi:MAG: hypothetical protein MJ084_04555 [Saccharofermentans sp.]|nr:hypothetical protein [Saccharofermentans sp.]
MKDYSFTLDPRDDSEQNASASRDQVFNILSLKKEYELDEVDYRTMLAEIRA